ncbi:MAG TPA: hypothetical protein VF659_23580 [Pyrinomonadaceae bacterium]|jgi:hypothetical protein
MNNAWAERPTPWVAMGVATFVVSAVTLLVFGGFGGLTLLLALNGFSERTGGVIIVVYVLLVLLGNLGAATLVNWLIARRRYAGTRPAGWAPLLVALGATALMLVAGPPVAVVLIKVIF